MTVHSIRGFIAEASAFFRTAGLGPLAHEAEWLLAHVLGKSRSQLYLDESAVSAETAVRFRELVRRRAKGEPLQYLIGETEFFGARFIVGPEVLIPRPETESVLQVLIDAVLRKGIAHKPLRIIDFGTGSGCIAVTLARLLPACHVVAVEVSYSALTIARKNAGLHGVADRIHFVQCHWAQALRGRADVLVSNPPYVPTPEVERLPLDVRCEPRVSLDGGPDGMRDLFQLIQESERLLLPEGFMALECGDGQVAPLIARAQAQGNFSRIESITDLAGRGRGVLFQTMGG